MHFDVGSARNVYAFGNERYNVEMKKFHYLCFDQMFDHFYFILNTFE